jgi:hypothetical protein
VRDAREGRLWVGRGEISVYDLAIVDSDGATSTASGRSRDHCRGVWRHGNDETLCEVCEEVLIRARVGGLVGWEFSCLHNLVLSECDEVTEKRK